MQFHIHVCIIKDANLLLYVAEWTDIRLARLIQWRRNYDDINTSMMTSRHVSSPKKPQTKLQQQQLKNQLAELPHQRPKKSLAELPQQRKVTPMTELLLAPTIDPARGQLSGNRH